MELPLEDIVQLRVVLVSLNLGIYLINDKLKINVIT